MRKPHVWPFFYALKDTDIYQFILHIVLVILPGLAEKGFTAEVEPQEDATNADGSGLTVTVPVNAVSLDNLKNLLEAKGALIKKALGITDISIKVEDAKVLFPWFPEMPEPDEVKAYTEFIAAICRMSKEQKRISATERHTDNEKFTFRVFLIRLGFIGDEYKTTRRILLRNLPGTARGEMERRRRQNKRKAMLKDKVSGMALY